MKRLVNFYHYLYEEDVPLYYAHRSPKKQRKRRPSEVFMVTDNDYSPAAPQKEPSAPGKHTRTKTFSGPVLARLYVIGFMVDALWLLLRNQHTRVSLGWWWLAVATGVVLV